MRDKILSSLNQINDSNPQESITLLDHANELLPNNDELILASEDYLNDLFIIKLLLSLFAEYSQFWDTINKSDFVKSWVILQNSLDLLRTIKRFSKFKLIYFERQLISIEKLFPYKVFASSGFIYSYAECSICRKDIESDECEHLIGELYYGRIASKIITKIDKLDHIALVPNPVDKRCVIKIENSAKSFAPLRYLNSILKKHDAKISNFLDVKTNGEHARIILSENSHFTVGMLR